MGVRVGGGRADRGRVAQVGEPGRVDVDDQVHGRAGQAEVAQAPADGAGGVGAAVVGGDEARPCGHRVGDRDVAGEGGPVVADGQRVGQVVAGGDRVGAVRLADVQVGGRLYRGRLGGRLALFPCTTLFRSDRGRVAQVGEPGRVDVDDQVHGRAGQ